MKCFSPISDIKIDCFSFQPIDSRMYVILTDREPGKAVVVDPCISEEAEQLLKDAGIMEITVFLTHEHYDHISGVNWLREQFSCTIIANTECGQAIGNPAKNKSKYFEILFLNKESEVQKQVKDLHIRPFSCEADVVFEAEYSVDFGGHQFFLTTRKGHSPSSICILMDNNCLFSGDTLLRTVPITRRPEGDKQVYYQQTLPWLMSLDKEMMVYPGHGECGRMKEMYLYQDEKKAEV